MDVPISGVLGYSCHQDPQLRGQAALIACSILKLKAIGFHVSTVETERLLAIINGIVVDKETATASRLAVQGLRQCLSHVLESPLCSKMATSLNNLLRTFSNPYWLVKVDLLDIIASLSWISLEYGMRNSQFSIVLFQKDFFGKFLLPIHNLTLFFE